MSQALWFRTQEEDYCTLSQFRRLTRGLRKDKASMKYLIEKTPAKRVKREAKS
jgi:hypothetical protein